MLELRSENVVFRNRNGVLLAGNLRILLHLPGKRNVPVTRFRACGNISFPKEKSINGMLELRSENVVFLNRNEVLFLKISEFCSIYLGNIVFPERHFGLAGMLVFPR